jgi:hypothetical protein
MGYLDRIASPTPARTARLTVGHSSVLRIVGDECQAHGVCSLELDVIAARAGVCRTTVRNALREARKLGLIKLQERRRLGQPSLTNIVRIVSSEWKLWLRGGENSRLPAALVDTGTRVSLAPDADFAESISRASKVGRAGQGGALVRQLESTVPAAADQVAE